MKYKFQNWHIAAILIGIYLIYLSNVWALIPSFTGALLPEVNIPDFSIPVGEQGCIGSGGTWANKLTTLDSSDSLSGWTASVSAGTFMSLDTLEKKEGSASINLFTSEQRFYYKTLDHPFDAVGGRVYVDVYIADPSELAGLNIYLGTDESTWAFKSYGPSTLSAGWNTLGGDISTFLTAYSPSIDLTQLDYLRILITPVSDIHEGDIKMDNWRLAGTDKICTCPAGFLVDQWGCYQKSIKAEEYLAAQPSATYERYPFFGAFAEKVNSGTDYAFLIGAIDQNTPEEKAAIADFTSGICSGSDADFIAFLTDNLKDYSSSVHNTCSRRYFFSEAKAAEIVPQKGWIWCTSNILVLTSSKGLTDAFIVIPDITGACALPGDLDKDGTFGPGDVAKLNLMISEMLPQDICGDLDGDGILGPGDMVKLKALIANTPPVDPSCTNEIFSTPTPSTSDVIMFSGMVSNADGPVAYAEVRTEYDFSIADETGYYTDLWAPKDTAGIITAVFPSHQDPQQSGTAAYAAGTENQVIDVFISAPSVATPSGGGGGGGGGPSQSGSCPTGEIYNQAQHKCVASGGIMEDIIKPKISINWLYLILGLILISSPFKEDILYKVRRYTK